MEPEPSEIAQLIADLRANSKAVTDLQERLISKLHPTVDEESGNESSKEDEEEDELIVMREQLVQAASLVKQV